MKQNRTLIYWSPFIDKVATVKATYNSVQSLNRYSRSQIKCKIIDVFGEWKSFKYFGLKKDLFYSLKDIPQLNKFSSKGYLKSRLKYLLIFFICFFPLKNFLKKEKPDFLVIHLVTSLPLLLNLIFNFKTKIILRISGKPKLNFFRYFFWKICLKKVYKVTCPTEETLQYLKKKNLIENKKLFYLAIGRLTKQKNFKFLIKAFKEIHKTDKNINLVILGDGENYKSLKLLIERFKLQDKITLAGYKNNIFEYSLNCKAFILTSLWEDPGFVLIEAMLSNALILSSDCSSGPKEIVGNNRGVLFKSNSKEDFIEKFNEINLLSNEDKFKKIVNAKKFIKKFTLVSHYKNFSKIIYD